MLKRVLMHPVFVLVEFILLCLVVPGYIIVTKSAAFMFAFLWGGCLYCWIIYRVCLFNGHAGLWRSGAVNLRNVLPILGRWALACVGMTAFLYFYDPERLFYLLRSKPGFIPALMVAYPLLSALPQEFIFCPFFFNRYERFFGRSYGMVLASALVFAYVHMLYINWIAPSFGFIAGLIFALTYLRTRSLALVTVEHGLYGDALFIIGLGWYFYSGAVH